MIQQRAVVFDDRLDGAAILGLQEMRGVIAHVAQALHDDRLAFERAGHVGGGHIARLAEEFAQGVLHPPARRLDPALDAARIGRLAGDTGGGVDVGGVHAAVLVRDPGHFPFAGAHVGRGHVLRGVDQVALGQLIGKAAGDLFQFMFFPFPRIDTEPALGAAKRGLDQGAFVGHQRRQRLDLILVDGHGVTDAALDRLHVFGMHRPVAGEGLDLTAQPDPEAYRVGRVADPYLFLKPRGQVHQTNGAVEHEVDALTEGRFLDLTLN